VTEAAIVGEAPPEALVERHDSRIEITVRVVTTMTVGCHLFHLLRRDDTVYRQRRQAETHSHTIQINHLRLRGATSL
jgi:hypothetical protein